MIRTPTGTCAPTFAPATTRSTTPTPGARRCLRGSSGYPSTMTTMPSGTTSGMRPTWPTRTLRTPTRRRSPPACRRRGHRPSCKGRPGCQRSSAGRARRLGCASSRRSAPRFGYRRLHALLRREGRSVNRKLVYRLYKTAGLSVRRRSRRKLRATRPLHTGERGANRDILRAREWPSRSNLRRNSLQGIDRITLT
jgi:hypothetical protein